jgi:hypothetical protein
MALFGPYKIYPEPNAKTFRLERLDQAILEVIDNPEETQQTTAIGT